MAALRRPVLVSFAIASLPLLCGCGGPERAIEEKLREHVIFFSNFERGVDALWSEGSPVAEFDGALSHHALNGGVADGCLKFEKGAGALSYRAPKNFAYAPGGFEGGVSFWLSTDVASLEADFPEPFHIGKRDANAFPWDDAVIFLDFTKPPVRNLRFGCYPSKTSEISDEMVSRHVIVLSGATWTAGSWHHVALTWRSFNSGRPDAEWAMFVDGAEVGRRSGVRIDLDWAMNSQVFRFNHYAFVGGVDEIAVFNVALTAEDAAYLHSPKKNLNTLLRK